MQAELEKQALEYIAATQPLIEQLTDALSRYRTKAASVGPAFVDSGLIAKDSVKKFTEKLASDPTIAIEYLLKLAGMLQPHTDELGAPATKESSVGMDAFQRWAAYGDPNANPSASTATV